MHGLHSALFQALFRFSCGLSLTRTIHAFSAILHKTFID